uniref:Uncharacterized protein n=1 Tax=Candidatus Kentrum eta TaxID=2126337 RepID=A0A450UPL1_9GAMM|nr:MAG: hypothetical protein BECKH772A_GA0070896_100619 [Candidatus Kentron sp. H]VFJ94483.1 MAG: hypothetical protein BECKH772B_GA0070898_100629 [Candidatus Kentron sp. H]VFK00980.1 MAG: hypothetical protein BECKH772C_GA0070978_100569 [Candidatus Kentron sp. H]
MYERFRDRVGCFRAPYECFPILKEPFRVLRARFEILYECSRGSRELFQAMCERFRCRTVLRRPSGAALPGYREAVSGMEARSPRGLEAWPPAGARFPMGFLIFGWHYSSHPRVSAGNNRAIPIIRPMDKGTISHHER